VVIELKRGEVTEIVLNNLYGADADWRRCSASTWWPCRTGSRRADVAERRVLGRSFHSGTAAKVVTLAHHLRSRQGAAELAHILEGLAVALANIDAGDRAHQGRALAPPEARNLQLQAPALATGRGHPHCL